MEDVNTLIQNSIDKLLKLYSMENFKCNINFKPFRNHVFGSVKVARLRFYIFLCNCMYLCNISIYVSISG